VRKDLGSILFFLLPIILLLFIILGYYRLKGILPVEEAKEITFQALVFFFLMLTLLLPFFSLFLIYSEKVRGRKVSRRKKLLLRGSSFLLGLICLGGAIASYSGKEIFLFGYEISSLFAGEDPFSNFLIYIFLTILCFLASIFPALWEWYIYIFVREIAEHEK
jgi:hypothetical protein